MLVLTRKREQRIVIGDNIVIKVLAIHGGRVRLGIEAPAEVSIKREELRSSLNIATTESELAARTA